VIGAFFTGAASLIFGVLERIERIRWAQRHQQLSDERDDYTDKRVDGWAKFNLRRGKAEYDKKLRSPIQPEGPVTAESPTISGTMRPEVREAFRMIEPVLHGLRHRHHKLDDIRFAEVLEEEIGDWMSKVFCPAFDVDRGACLIAALKIANESPTPDEWKTPK
jgi:hypothetical protein